MRNAALREVTSIVVSKSRIYARTDDVATASEFDSTSGARLSGSLDLTPEEVLYLVWRQRQTASLSEHALRKLWNASRAGGWRT